MRFAHEHAREVANDGALEHLAMLHDAPALSDGVVVDAASRFVLMRNLARQNLLTLRQEYPEATDAALHFQAWNLTRVTSTSTADELRDIGVVANRSAQLAIDEIVTAYDSGVEIDVEQSSIIPQMPDSHDD